MAPLLVLGKVQKTVYECDSLSRFVGALAANVRLGLAFLACPSRALGAGADVLGTLGHGDEGRAGVDPAVELVLAGELVELGFVDGQMLLSFIGAGGCLPDDVDVDDTIRVTTVYWCKDFVDRGGEETSDAGTAPNVIAWKRVDDAGEVEVWVVSHADVTLAR